MIYWPAKTTEEMPTYNAVLQTADSVLNGNMKILVHENLANGHLLALKPVEGKTFTRDDLQAIESHLRKQHIYNSFEGIALDPLSGCFAIDLRGFTPTPVREKPAGSPEPLEMANYIEIDKYNRYEAGHPGYSEMMRRIVEQVIRLAPDGQQAHVAEVGAGTGELTLRLGKTNRAHTDAVEFDSNCAGYLRHKITDGDIVNATLHAQNFFDFVGGHEGHYDAVASSFTDHHFSPEVKKSFLQSIVSILKHGGAYIVGDEFLPPHDESDPAQRVTAQIRYHGMIIEEAFREGKVELPKLELDALISGLRTTVPFIQQTDVTAHDNEFRVRPGTANDYNRRGIAALDSLAETLGKLPLERLPNPERLPAATIVRQRKAFLDRLRHLSEELAASPRAGLEIDLSQGKTGGDYKMTIRQYVAVLKDLHLKASGYFEGPRHVGDVPDRLDRKLGQPAIPLDAGEDHAGGVWVLKVEVENTASRLAAIASGKSRLKP